MTSTEVATRPAQKLTPVQLFVGDVLAGSKRDEIASSLPAHVPFGRFERNLSNAVMREPRLLRCDPRVVFREVCKIAALGLLLDPQLGEAYLIVDSKNDVQARIGYRGLIKLAHQSGKVSTVYAHDICERDVCEISLGTDKRIVHKPNFMEDRGAAKAYYAVAKFKDGEVDFEPMSLAEIYRIRDRSDAWRAFRAGKIKSTPWGTDEGEMSKKTVLRRFLKRVPMSPDIERALAMEDEADRRDNVIEHDTAAPRPRTLTEKFDAIASQSAPSNDTEIDEIVDEDGVITDGADGAESATDNAGANDKKDEPAGTAPKTPDTAPTTASREPGEDDADAEDAAAGDPGAEADPVLDGLRAKAMQGVGPFETAWRRLADPEKKRLADQHAGLMEAARQADRAAREG